MRISLATIIERWDIESLEEERESRQNLGHGAKAGRADAREGPRRGSQHNLN